MLTIRSATSADASTLFDLRNRPEIVLWSSERVMVTWDEHVAWFESRLAVPDAHRIYFGELDGEIAGVARFDRAGADAVISAYLVPGLEGRGLGTQLISASSRAIAAQWPIGRVVACVRFDNPRARAAFARSGYLLVERDQWAIAAPPDHVVMAMSGTTVR